MGDFKVLLLLLPILGMVGGLTIAIIRTIGRQRQIELLQRERIAALERGIDPQHLPSISNLGQELEALNAAYDPEARMARGLLVTGILLLSVGIGLVVLFLITEEQGHAWTIGLVPIAVGLGMLVASFVTRGWAGGDGKPAHGR